MYEHEEPTLSLLSATIISTAINHSTSTAAEANEKVLTPKTSTQVIGLQPNLKAIVSIINGACSAAIGVS